MDIYHAVAKSKLTTANENDYIVGPFKNSMHIFLLYFLQALFKPA